MPVPNKQTKTNKQTGPRTDASINSCHATEDSAAATVCLHLCLHISPLISYVSLTKTVIEDINTLIPFQLNTNHIFMAQMYIKERALNRRHLRVKRVVYIQYVPFCSSWMLFSSSRACILHAFKLEAHIQMCYNTSADFFLITPRLWFFPSSSSLGRTATY